MRRSPKEARRGLLSAQVQWQGSQTVLQGLVHAVAGRNPCPCHSLEIQCTDLEVVLSAGAMVLRLYVSSLLFLEVENVVCGSQGYLLCRLQARGIIFEYDKI